MSLSLVVVSFVTALSMASGANFTTVMQPGVDVAVELAGAFNTACLRVVHATNLTFAQGYETHLFVRGLMRGSLSARFQTVTPLPFSQFRHSATCYKPLEIFVTTNETKAEFTQLCKRFRRISSSLWMVFMINGESEEEFFRAIPIPFDIQLLAITELVDNVDAKGVSRRLIREVYRNTPSSPVRTTLIGSWSSAEGLNIPLTSIYRRRLKLDGLVLRTGSIENWPITSFKEVKPGTYKLDGFFALVWSELETLLDFRSIHYRSVDNSTGIREESGKWNGLVGMLLRDEIDFIVSELNINTERTEVMDFTHPLLKTSYQVYFQPPGYNLAWTAVLQPFHYQLWLALLLWVALGTAVLSACYRGVRDYHPPCDLSLQPSRTFFFMLQSMCQQGYSQVPESYACRLVFLLAYLLSAIIIPSYSASLISSLTAQTPNRPFDSLEDMLKFQHYKLLLVRNSAEYSHFAQSQDSLYTRVFSELVWSGTNSTNATYHDSPLVCDRKQPLAIFGVESTMEIRISNIARSIPDCHIIKFSQPLSVVYQGMGLRKSHPLAGLINFHIGRMFAVGIIGRLQRTVWPPTTHRQEADFTQVSASEVFQIFFCLAAGIVIATAVLLLEILVDSRRRLLEARQQRQHPRWGWYT